VKKIALVFALTAVFALLGTGCIRAPNYPGVVQIQTNEIAFMVDMTGDGSVSAGDSDIQRKDIVIPGYFVRTGRFDYQGYWRPTTKVIVVSQAPVRLDWDRSDTTRTIRMTSSESSGFVVPMMINAYIADKAGAYKYLSAFKPISDESIDWSRVEQKDWGSYVKESAQPLETALNTVVYTKIMEQLAVLFVKTPILNAEVASKIYIPAVFEGKKASDLRAAIKSALGIDINFTEDVASLKDWALEKYGITITAMAPGDGVLYDNDEVQKQIDNLAAGVMKEKTLVQDRTNAQAEQQVKIIEASTRAREAEIQASIISVRAREQEIINSRTIAEATAEAIKSGKVVPAGSYPVGLTSLIVTPNYNSLGR